MRLGVVLPDESAEADPRRIVEVARRAEVLGFDSVWLPDHLLPPSEYGPVYGGVFEPLILLSHIAAVTTRITLDSAGLDMKPTLGRGRASQQRRNRHAAVAATMKTVPGSPRFPSAANSNKRTS
ncbi:LLM class flavin-dependent oxidoreductase [Phytohabitans rumicis]|uniref:Luciferase-like domain-containing protein n=1 Tax=Phytohabitans rumicis TaxID=1076125 RepID=A0A6V8KXM2_9ACTN|nr:LLM class flavin-dependent oxidoreductase [Phytohabitans rumicis]GFJ87438.1 hypothetical protein Prum_010800 [Phytohabitans rumicis]